jgi:hypothetical protein
MDEQATQAQGDSQALGPGQKNRGQEARRGGLACQAHPTPPTLTLPDKKKFLLACRDP